MAGAIEVRASGAKFRYVVVNRNGDKLVQSGQFDDKASAKRAATSLLKAVSGATIVDATKPTAAVSKAKPSGAARRPPAKR
jgi:hypothetical protein